MKLREPGAAPGRIHTERLWTELRNLAKEEGVIADDYRIADSVVREALERFLPVRSAPDLDVQYWRSHGLFAGELMAAFATIYGRNVDLYRTIGVLHDADYYLHPHYGGSDDFPVHPAPLCTYLLETGVPAVACLAILEHAGYTGEGKNFSSALSAAISGCDDLATFASSLQSSESEVVKAGGFSPDWSQISEIPTMLLDSVGMLPPIFPRNFVCPRRVLSDVDGCVNRPLLMATDLNTGSFLL